MKKSIESYNFASNINWKLNHDLFTSITLLECLSIYFKFFTILVLK